MKTFRIIDVTTANVVAKLDADDFHINGTLVTFTGEYTNRSVGVMVITPGILIAEAPKES